MRFAHKISFCKRDIALQKYCFASVISFCKCNMFYKRNIALQAKYCLSNVISKRHKIAPSDCFVGGRFWTYVNVVAPQNLRQGVRLFVKGVRARRLRSAICQKQANTGVHVCMRTICHRFTVGTFFVGAAPIQWLSGCRSCLFSVFWGEVQLSRGR